MTNPLAIERVSALPPLGERRAATIYFVSTGADHLEIWVTGRKPSTIRRLPTLADITAVVGSGGGGSGGGVSDFADLTGKPTSLAGYGILDGVSDAELALALASKVDSSAFTSALAGKSDAGHTHGFASLTGKPTTLDGYGITDAASAASVLLKANSADVTAGLSTKADLVHNHAFADLTGKPTTLAGYGITDGATSAALASKADANDVVNLSSNQAVNGKKTFLREIVLPNLASDPSSLSGAMLWYNSTEQAMKAYIGGQVVTMYRLTVDDPMVLSAGVMFYDLMTDTLKLRKGSTTVTLADSSHAHSFASLTGKPTTLAGYGITDAVKAGNAGMALTVSSTAPATPALNDVWVDSATESFSFSELSGRPTTMAGYGIVDRAMMDPGPRPTVGQWFFVNSRGKSGTAGCSVDLLRLSPSALPYDITIDSLALTVLSAVAGSVAKFVIYESDALGRPGSLLLETSDVATASQWEKNAVFSPITLTRNRVYWIGIRTSGAISVVSPSLTTLIWRATMSSDQGLCIQRTVSYATPAPSTWTWSESEVSLFTNPAAILARAV